MKSLTFHTHTHTHLPYRKRAPVPVLEPYQTIGRPVPIKRVQQIRAMRTSPTAEKKPIVTEIENPEENKTERKYCRDTKKKKMRTRATHKALRVAKSISNNIIVLNTYTSHNSSCLCISRARLRYWTTVVRLFGGGGVCRTMRVGRRGLRTRYNKTYLSSCRSGNRWTQSSSFSQPRYVDTPKRRNRFSSTFDVNRACVCARVYAAAINGTTSRQ